MIKAQPKTKKPYARFQYSIENIQDVVEKVKNKEMSLSHASSVYKIPKTTLFRYVHQVNVSIERKMGPTPVLSASEEVRIKNWIIAKAKVGFPMHKEAVKDAVQKILKETGRPNPFADDRPGKSWMNLFLKRHPEITNTNTELLSKARACVTEESIRQWFNETILYFKQEGALDVLSDSDRVYNLDEIGIEICPKSGKLLGARKERDHYRIANGQEKQSITVLCCYSASGIVIDPMIIYPYQRIPGEIMKHVPDNIAVGRSPTGWIITPTFFEYSANILYKKLVQKGIKFPIALFLDGHKSHVSMEMHDFCVEKKILVVRFIAHASHIQQACDVGIYKCVKTEWRKVVLQHQQSSTEPITRINFAPLFAAAHANAAKPTTIQNAFRRSGLFPFNPENVDYSKCMSTRHKEIRLLEAPEKILSENKSVRQEVVLADSLLCDIESKLPPEVKSLFLSAYESQEEPRIEKVLFSIWKKAKINSLTCKETVQSTSNSIIIEPLTNYLKTSANVQDGVNIDTLVSQEVTFENNSDGKYFFKCFIYFSN